MILASLFAISALLGSVEQGAAPSLAVLEVSVPAAADGTCRVTLLNTNSRSAVAWVITRLPDRRSNRITDVSVSPELAVAPGTTRVIEVSWCHEGEPPAAVEVAAAVYDDGSNFGEESVLEHHLFAGQRKRANALRELASLMSAAQVSPRPGISWSAAIGELIDQAGGPQVDAGARHFARFALQRLAPQLTSGRPASTEQIDAVKRNLVSEITAAAARLDKSSKAR